MTNQSAHSHRDILTLLEDKARYLLEFNHPKIPRDKLHLPSPNYLATTMTQTNRSPEVMESLQRLFNHGRLGGTGYLSILPVDQGIEHTAGASFAINPDYFDPENIVKLAIEGGSNAVASTFGVLAAVSDAYAHKIPFVVKLNHNQVLTYPKVHRQTLYASVKQAAEIGAVAVGATIYFGHEDSNREIEIIRQAFAEAHERGLATILWCYVRNSRFRQGDVNYETAVDLTGQACHLGVTVGADIIKQKMPEYRFGFQDLHFGKYSDTMYEKLISDHPIDLVRYQVANCYMGRFGLINSGGASGENDLFDAVTTAVINKRAGGMGLILGRKAFQKPFEEGIQILHAVQDVYLDTDITIA